MDGIQTASDRNECILVCVFDYLIDHNMAQLYVRRVLVSDASLDTVRHVSKSYTGRPTGASGHSLPVYRL